MASCNIPRVPENEPDVCCPPSVEAKYLVGILKRGPYANVVTTEDSSQELSPSGDERKALRRRWEGRAGISFGSSQVISISDLSDAVAETFTEEECARLQSPTTRAVPQSATVEPSARWPADDKSSSTVVESSTSKSADDPMIQATHVCGSKQAVTNSKSAAASSTTQAGIDLLADCDKELEMILNRTLRDIISWANSRKCTSCGEACQVQPPVRNGNIVDNSTELELTNLELKFAPVRHRADESRARSNRRSRNEDLTCSDAGGKDVTGRDVRSGENGNGTDSRCHNCSKMKTSRVNQATSNPRVNRRVPRTEDLERSEIEHSIGVTGKQSSWHNQSSISAQEQGSVRFALADDSRITKIALEERERSTNYKTEPGSRSSCASASNMERGADSTNRKPAKREPTPFKSSLRFGDNGSEAADDDKDTSDISMRDKNVLLQESPGNSRKITRKADAFSTTAASTSTTPHLILEDRGRMQARRKPAKRDQTPFNPALRRGLNSGNSEDTPSEASSPEGNASSNFVFKASNAEPAPPAERPASSGSGCAVANATQSSPVSPTKEVKDCMTFVPRLRFTAEAECIESTNEHGINAAALKPAKLDGMKERNTSLPESSNSDFEEELPRKDRRTWYEGMSSRECEETLLKAELSKISEAADYEQDSAELVRSSGSQGRIVEGHRATIIEKTPSEEERGRPPARRKPSKRDQTPFNPTLHRVLSGSDDWADPKEVSSLPNTDVPGGNETCRWQSDFKPLQAVSFSNDVGNLCCTSTDGGRNEGDVDSSISNAGQAIFATNTTLTAFSQEFSSRISWHAATREGSNSLGQGGAHIKSNSVISENEFVHAASEEERGRALRRRKPSKRDQTPFNTTLHRALSSSDGSTDSRDSPSMRAKSLETGEETSEYDMNRDTVTPNVSFSEDLVDVINPELAEKHGSNAMRARTFTRGHVSSAGGVCREMAGSDDSDDGSDDAWIRNGQSSGVSGMAELPTQFNRSILTNQNGQCLDRQPHEAQVGLVGARRKMVLQHAIALDDIVVLNQGRKQNGLDSRQIVRQTRSEREQTPFHLSGRRRGARFSDVKERTDELNNPDNESPAESYKLDEILPKAVGPGALAGPCEEAARGRGSSRRKPGKRDQTPFNPVLYQDENSSSEESDTTQFVKSTSPKSPGTDVNGIRVVKKAEEVNGGSEIHSHVRNRGARFGDGNEHTRKIESIQNDSPAYSFKQFDECMSKTIRREPPTSAGAEEARGRASSRRKPGKRDQTPFNPVLYYEENRSSEETDISGFAKYIGPTSRTTADDDADVHERGMRKGTEEADAENANGSDFKQEQSQRELSLEPTNTSPSTFESSVECLSSSVSQQRTPISRSPNPHGSYACSGPSFQCYKEEELNLTTRPALQDQHCESTFPYKAQLNTTIPVSRVDGSNRATNGLNSAAEADVGSQETDKEHSRNEAGHSESVSQSSLASSSLQSDSPTTIAWAPVSARTSDKKGRGEGRKHVFLSPSNSDSRTTGNPVGDLEVVEAVAVMVQNIIDQTLNGVALVP